VKVELLMETTRPVTLVVPQDDEDEEENDDPSTLLQAYAPMYTTLIDPPYELSPLLPVAVVLQPELFTLLMDTLTPLAVVDPDVMLLLLPPPLMLQAYAPRYNENDPPYELPASKHIAVALQPELFTLLMNTLTPLAVVDPDVMLLLLLLLTL